MRALRIGLGAAALSLLAMPALAQSLSVDLGEGGTVTGQLVRLVLLITVLSLAPSILVMVTSFTRIVVVLAFLRSALGLQQTPPNAVLMNRPSLLSSRSTPTVPTAKILTVAASTVSYASFGASFGPTGWPKA
jgi:flagellar biosynthetic protein FliP